MLKVLWLSLCAAVISTSLTALLIKVATLRGWVVIPSQNRWNKRTVAQFGGGPVLLTFWGVAMFAPGSYKLAAVLLATVAMSLLGLVDDIKGLGPKPKLVVEALLAFAVLYAGIVLPISSIPILDMGLTVLWIIAITNAFNIIDNMDGLAGGTAIIALFAIALLAGISTPYGIASLLLMVSLIGFFIFNLNPARIFMGDLGALPIGFFLACGAVVASASVPRRGAAVFIPCMLLAVPLFDVLLVSVTRRLKGRAVSQGARDHSSHRLVFLGMTERGAVATLHFVCLLSGLLALSWATIQSDWIAPALVLFFLVLSHWWSHLAEIRLPESWLSKMVVAPAPEFVLTRSKAALSVLREFAVLAFGVYFALLVQPDHEGIRMFGRFGIVAGAVCLLRSGFLWIRRNYQDRRSPLYSRAASHNVTAIILSVCLFAPCWFFGGLPFPRALGLIGWDVLIASCLLLSSELAGAAFRRFSMEPRFSVAPAVTIRSSTLRRAAGSFTSGHDFPHLAGSQEVADEVEL
jgi:UDP-GlcNAc:undecaprenyl-phosphate GlcNAc-1-phosphate transferase